MIATAEIKTERPMNVSLTATPSAAAKSAVRVWLTDDNALIRSTVNSLLEQAGGFVCEQEFDSAEALLQALETRPHPDVILMDIEMGGMNGVEALRPIRALAPGVRVLIMTAFFDPIYEKQAMRRGAAAFLVKSYAFARIPKEIHAALARPMPELTPEPPAEVESAPAAIATASPSALSTWLVRWAGKFAPLFRLPTEARPVAAPALPISAR